uniref:hypothetical protein n=1 Tax=Marinobacterium profundum TaxID=1714300 RepID=UPI001315A32C|nr:hypothetical protein [Marinobacterium profundum]
MASINVFLGGLELNTPRHSKPARQEQLVVSQVSSIPQDVTAMGVGPKHVDSHSGRRRRPEDYSPKNGEDIKASA